MDSHLMKLNVRLFSEIFHEREEDMPVATRNLINSYNLTFRVLEGSERDQAILRVLRILDTPLTVSGQSRQFDWESGWEENLQDFRASDYDLEKLIPKYYFSGKNDVMRMNGKYICSENPRFELCLLDVLRNWIAFRFFVDADTIYEFGCGPGHNLAAFAKIMPEKRYVGADWAKSSQEILSLMAQHHGLNVKACYFDFFSETQELRLEPRSVVLTLGAMEQVGTAFEPFLNYLLGQNPLRVIHVEPIYELFNQAKLMDYLGARYDEKRGYLRGFLTRLRELQARRIIAIERIHKTIGSLVHDGWSVVVWKPKRDQPLKQKD